MESCGCGLAVILVIIFSCAKRNIFFPRRFFFLFFSKSFSGFCSLCFSCHGNIILGLVVNDLWKKRRVWSCNKWASHQNLLQCVWVYALHLSLESLSWWDLLQPSHCYYCENACGAWKFWFISIHIKAEHHCHTVGYWDVIVIYIVIFCSIYTLKTINIKYTFYITFIYIYMI